MEGLRENRFSRTQASKRIRDQLVFLNDSDEESIKDESSVEENNELGYLTDVDNDLESNDGVTEKKGIFKYIPKLTPFDESERICNLYIDLCNVNEENSYDWRVLEDLIDHLSNKYTKDLNYFIQMNKEPAIIPIDVSKKYAKLNKDYDLQIKVLSETVKIRASMSDKDNAVILKDFMGKYTDDLPEEDIIKSVMMLLLMIKVNKSDWDYYLNPVDSATNLYLKSIITKLKILLPKK